MNRDEYKAACFVIRDAMSDKQTEKTMYTRGHTPDAVAHAFQIGQNSDHEYTTQVPVPMLLWCPECGARHLDEGEFATKEHHTHACQNCGHVWRPAKVNTRGVQFLPGFGPKEST